MAFNKTKEEHFAVRNGDVVHALTVDEHLNHTMTVKNRMVRCFVLEMLMGHARRFWDFDGTGETSRGTDGQTKPIIPTIANLLHSNELS